MAISNSVSASIALINLASFMLASGLLVLGFKTPPASRLGIRVGYVLFVVGTLTATVHAFIQGSTPLLLAATLAWATVISWFVWRIELVGAFTSPIIAIVLMSGIFFYANKTSPVVEGVDVPIRLHVAFAVLGQSFAILACALSLLLLWLDKKLKNRQLAELPLKFPAMSTLSRALSVTLWIGFLFITLSLLSGAMYAMSGLITPGVSLIPKISWAILVWVWYLSILVQKAILGHRPQKVARMSLVGFLILAVSWFGLIFWAPWGFS